MVVRCDADASELKGRKKSNNNRKRTRTLICVEAASDQVFRSCDECMKIICVPHDQGVHS